MQQLKKLAQPARPYFKKFLWGRAIFEERFAFKSFFEKHATTNSKTVSGSALTQKLTKIQAKPRRAITILQSGRA